MSRSIQILTGALEGRCFTLAPGDVIRLGRSSRHNDVVLSHDPWISSTHALIKNEGDQIQLMDLDSSNGTFLDGHKVLPRDYEVVTSFFVLGSTLCRVSDMQPATQDEPLSLKAADASRYLAQPMFVEARRIANEQGAAAITVLHLFMALMDAGHADISLYLKDIRRDESTLRRRVDRLRIFDGEHSWMNAFLKYHQKPGKPSDQVVSPLVQDVFRRFDFSPELAPVDLLQSLLAGAYNLLFPLLELDTAGKPAGQENEAGPTADWRDLPSPDIGVKLPARFWKALNDELVHGHVVLLTGGEGGSKTSILKQCFTSLLRVDISHFKPDHRHIFDPKLFLVFHEEDELAGFLDMVITALGSARVIAIDHFGYLLKLLNKRGQSLQPLIDAINQRRVPVLLGLDVDNLALARGMLRDTSNLHLEDFLESLTTDELSALFRDFETRVRCKLSTRAQTDLPALLLKKYGMEAIQDFLDYCENKLRRLAIHHRALGWQQEKKGKSLSMAFFKTMLGEWDVPAEADAWRISQKSRLGGMEPPAHSLGIEDPSQARLQSDKAFAAQVETLLFGFYREFLEIEVAYSDSSRSIQEHRRLDLEQKRSELLGRLEAVLRAFRPAFEEWFGMHHKDIDPRTVQATSGLEGNPEALWEELVYRFELMDSQYAVDHFFEICRGYLKTPIDS